MRRRNRHTKLRDQVSRIVAALICVIILISLFYSATFANIINDNSFGYFEREAQARYTEVQGLLSEIETQITLLINNTSTASYWNAESRWDRSLYARAMRDNIENSVRASAAAEAIMIQFENGVFLEAHAFDEDLWIELLRNLSSTRTEYSRFPTVLTLGDETRCTHLVLRRTMQVYDSDTTLLTNAAKIYVVIRIDSLLPDSFDQDTFSSIMLKKGDGLSVVTFAGGAEQQRAANGFAAAFPALTEDAFIHIGNTDYVYKCAELGNTELCLVTLQSRNTFFSRSIFVIVIGILLIAGSLVFSVIGVQYMNRSIAAPMSSMEYSMKRISNGDVQHRLAVQDDSELGQLASGVNELLDKLKENSDALMESQQQLYQKDLLEKESRLLALQFQINPHFLYNTLECVRSIAAEYGADDVTRIIAAMIGIFRYSASSSGRGTVRDEIACCSNYGEIMRIRFQGKYAFEIEADASILNAQMPRMLLQPLVENAVLHGLEGRSGPGTIHVTCTDEGSDIAFCVHDSGPGMRHDKLEELKSWLEDADNAHPNAAAKAKEHGIGLKNVDQRLQHEYGKSYGLSLKSEYGSYMEVNFRVPMAGRENTCQSNT